MTKDIPRNRYVKRKNTKEIVQVHELKESISRLCYAIERKKSMYGANVDVSEEQETIHNLTRILQERETRLFHNL